MEDTLKRLLEAEQYAQRQIENAERERDRIIEQARQEAHDAETGFERRMDELRQSKFEHSDEQAEQEIAELEREHDQQLEKLAEQARDNRRLALQQTLDCCSIRRTPDLCRRYGATLICTCARPACLSGCYRNPASKH